MPRVKYVGPYDSVIVRSAEGRSHVARGQEVEIEDFDEASGLVQGDWEAVDFQAEEVVQPEGSMFAAPEPLKPDVEPVPYSPPEVPEPEPEPAPNPMVPTPAEPEHPTEPPAVPDDN